MSIFKKKKRTYKTAARSENESNEIEAVSNSNAEKYEKNQNALLHKIFSKMLTESDVRRIVDDEFSKLMAKQNSTPSMTVISNNNNIEVIEKTENEELPTRIPFPMRMLEADDELKQCYNELKAEALAYGLKSRLSNTGDTFRLHTKTYLKITVVGKTIKCYFALNPEDYRESSIPVGDAGLKNIYKDIPLVLKVKSPLSLRRAKQLLSDACKKDNLYVGKIINKDWVTPLKNYEPQL